MLSSDLSSCLRSGVDVSREQQEDLDPILGETYSAYGKRAADLVMAAYLLGREHGEAPPPLRHGDGAS